MDFKVAYNHMLNGEFSDLDLNLAGYTDSTKTSVFFLEDPIIHGVDKVLEYARELVGTQYEFWIGGENTLEEEAPFWATDGANLNPAYIKTKTSNCAGLINLVKKKAGGQIPYAVEGYRYAGGTWAWFDYLSKKNCLTEFDPTISYPKGTLLLRKYSDEIDQGHLAIVLEANSENSLRTKIIHSYPDNSYDGTNKICGPGIMIEHLENSVKWLDDGYYYHFATMPENWLFE